MTRQRVSSYSSSTISSSSSSTSSDSGSLASNATYASIKTLSSVTSRLSTNIKSVDFWNQFNRTSSAKKKSVKKIFNEIFRPKPKGEKSKNSSIILSTSGNTSEEETSFMSPARLAADSPTCPPGLYCVIDDFVLEYDLRQLEEEERAEQLANSSRAVTAIR